MPGKAVVLKKRPWVVGASVERWGRECWGQERGVCAPLAFRTLGFCPLLSSACFPHMENPPVFWRRDLSEAVFPAVRAPGQTGQRVLKGQMSHLLRLLETGSTAPFPSMTSDCIPVELQPHHPDSLAQFQETAECALRWEPSWGRKLVPFHGAQFCAWPQEAHSPCRLLPLAWSPASHTCLSTPPHTLCVFFRELSSPPMGSTSSPKSPVASSYVTLPKHSTRFLEWSFPGNSKLPPSLLACESSFLESSPSLSSWPFCACDFQGSEHSSLVSLLGLYHPSHLQQPIFGWIAKLDFPWISDTFIH